MDRATVITPELRLTAEQRALVESCIPMMHQRVIMLRKRSANLYRRMDYAELFDVCLDAVIRCAVNYDPARGVKFSTLAHFALFVHPVTQQIRRNRLREICRTVRDADVPGGTKTIGDASKLYLQNLEPDDKIPSRLEAMIETEERQRVENAAAAVLTERNREVLRRRMRGETLEAIGDVVGVTRERVRQIEQNSIKKIREHLQSQATAEPRWQALHDQEEAA